MNGNGSVFNSGGNYPGKDTPHLLRPGVGRQIPVMGVVPPDEVPDRASHQEYLLSLPGKNSGRFFEYGMYHALPYYERCLITLGIKQLLPEKPRDLFTGPKVRSQPPGI